MNFLNRKIKLLKLSIYFLPNNSKYCYSSFTKNNIKHLSMNNNVLNRLYSKQVKLKIQENNLFDNPIFYKEILKNLNLEFPSVVIDMTFGAGGHSTKILEKFSNVKIFALDRDPMAHECAVKLAEQYPDRVIPLLGRYSELPNLLKDHKILPNSIDAILFDFGCSSMQLNDASRGFSANHNGFLDMRMDGSRNPEQPTAADVLEGLDELDLIKILKVYGREKRAKNIARAILQTRYSCKKITTTTELKLLLDSIIGIYAINKLDTYGHTSSRTFEALRIFVNNELNEINYGLSLAEIYLKEGGKVITIAYSILEDTIVKQHLTGRINNISSNDLVIKYVDNNKVFNDLSLEQLTSSPWKMLHKHVIKFPWDDRNLNPHFQRAKMRILQKL